MRFNIAQLLNEIKHFQLWNVFPVHQKLRLGKLQLENGKAPELEAWQINESH